jgi:hypothetical protein
VALARDRYISECLTRPWRNPRYGHQSLCVVDFNKQKVITRNSDK